MNGENGQEPEATGNAATLRGNSLPQGVSSDLILDAIHKSGYPLQTLVEKILAPRFSVVQEWGFADADSGETRSLDVLAWRPLFEPQAAESMRIWPRLALLVECKRSELPYVFFSSLERQDVASGFPVVSGLPSSTLELRGADGVTYTRIPIARLLDLQNHSFVRDADSCVTFSKCVRKGSKLELSGSEPFLSLMRPLIKAQRHFLNQQRGGPSWKHYNAFLTLAVAVLDAPMVRFKAVTDEFAMVDWVRSTYHEHDPKAEPGQRDRIGTIDIVHIAFFEQYVNELAAGFADYFSHSVAKHESTLFSGKGSLDELPGGQV